MLDSLGDSDGLPLLGLEDSVVLDEVLDDWREYAIANGHEIDDWPR